MISKKKEENNKQKPEKKPDLKPLLETKNNLSILNHIFARFTLQPKKLTIKQKLKREFLAKTSSLLALDRLNKMLIESATRGTQQIVRIDLKPSSNFAQLLNDIKDFIPLEGNSKYSVRTKLQSTTFSPNRVPNHLKNKEKIHGAISIPVNDFAAFIVEQVQQKQQKKIFIPSLANQNNTVSIVGVTLDNQPTAIIFWVDGITGRTQPSSRLKHKSISHTPRLAI